MNDSPKVTLVGASHPGEAADTSYGYVGKDTRGNTVLARQRTSYPRRLSDGKMSFWRRLFWLVSLGVDWKHTT